MGRKPQKIVERVKEAWENPELDRTKAALEKLSREGKTIADLLKGALSKLDVDLNELDLSPDEKEKLKEAFRRRFEVFTAGNRKEAVLKSPEATQLAAFVDDFASYTKLTEVIAECKKKKSKDPLYKLLQTARASTPLLAGIGASLMEWLGEGKKKEERKDKPSKLEATAAKADEVLKKREKKKKSGKAVPAEEGQEEEAYVEAGVYAPAAIGAGAAELPIEGVETKVKSAGSVEYKISPKHAKKKLSPKEFRKTYLSIKDRKKRNEFVLAQVAAGNASNVFEKLKITGKTGMTVTMEVDKHGLRVAGMDVQVDGPTAMAAAMLSGSTLPTPWVSEQNYKYAKKTKGRIPFIAAPEIAKGLNIPWNKLSKFKQDTLRMSAKFAVKRDELLKDYRKKHGIKADQFEAGHFKDIVHPVKGATTPGMLEIFGGHYASGGRVQRLSCGFHGKTYSDYSHQLRRVRNTPESVTVTTKDGKEKKMSFTEFTANADYAKEFGFKAQKLGTPYITPELQKFADQNKPKEKAKKTS